MVGVYDYAELWCDTCKAKTKHETGWESEEPEVLDTECLTCHTKKRRS